MDDVWISKRDAIALVIAAERPDAVGSRASARSVLSQWVRRGLVRTKDGKRPPWAKRPRQLYRRADVARCIAARSPRAWAPHEDALLGTDVDRVIARRLRLTIDQVWARRQQLGIKPHGASTGRCNPGSWRRAPDDPRLEPPLRPTG